MVRLLPVELHLARLYHFVSEIGRGLTGYSLRGAEVDHRRFESKYLTVSTLETDSN